MSFKKSTVIVLICGLCVVLFFYLRGRICGTDRTKNTIVSGQIIHGKRFGRILGFPTANFEWPPDISPPAYGVYAVKTDRGIGIMNFGIRPTVEDTMHPLAEVHLLDFSGDLYGQTLTVEIVRKIRNEQKFSSPEALKRQIAKDVEVCRDFLGNKTP